MAVVEIYTSREMHITKEGSTITQFFSCSNTDWNAGGDGTTTLPIVGEKWSDDRPDLCVTDIRNRWRSNLNCIVEVTYSRGGFNYPQTLPDTRSSLVETFDFSVQPIQLIGEDVFWDTNSGASKSWRTHYKETYATKEPPPMPEPGVHIILTSKMNVSTWSWNTIMTSLGKVNNSDFVEQLRRATRPPRWIDVTTNDTGFWLFVGFNAVQIGNNNIELSMVFQGSGYYKWNQPYGVANMYMYRTTSFNALPFPTNEDDDVDDGLR